MKTIGIIAGTGGLPLLVAREARCAGFRVASCGIVGEADRALEEVSDACVWVKLGELGKVIQFFKNDGVSSACLAGKVHKTSLFSGRIRPDFEMIRALAGVKDWKDDSLLRALCGYLKKKGIDILDSTAFLKNSMAEGGSITRSKPSRKEREDIEFGWRLAKELGRLDIGQTVVVKRKAVLALEAIEGTDEAIRRGGKLGGEGAVVVKVAKPDQDMRFDVPVVGPSTLAAMREAKARVLAVEARKTILVGREELVSLADKHGIALVAK
jgi:DUF1009 family protein